jgi:predicted MPP superfamily phosphohydrolase
LLARLYGEWPAKLRLARSEVRRVDFSISVPSLKAGQELRVGFASDLHAGATTSPRMHEQAFAELRAFAPDLLLLGGDYVLFEARYVDQLLDLIRSVEAPRGRFSVLGNHDLWADDAYISSALESAGVELLINRTRRLDAIPITVGGLDDHLTGSPDYDRAFCEPAPIHLLLMHSPDHVPALAGRSFTLAVCGHTHGGHIALPGGIPLLTPSRLSRSFAAGRYQLPGGPLLVSRGIGNVEAPFRLFAPADVLCITLRGS